MPQLAIREGLTLPTPPTHASPRAADLRPAETQQLLDFYLGHRAPLQALLQGV
jgi:hypothetical protein